METLAHTLEALMVISFGVSWPMSILKSYRSRTTKGKSLFFLTLILFGYGCGIAWKLVDWKFNHNQLTYVSFFYVLNFVMVFTDLCIYFKNLKLDKKTEGK